METTKDKSKTQKIISPLLLLLTAMIWGFAFTAQRVGSESLGTFALNGIRFALGTLSLIPVILIFERKKTDKQQTIRTIFAGVAVGAILFTASALQQYGIELTQSAGRAGFLTGLYTVFVPIISVVFYGEKKGIFIWLGVLSAITGLFFVSVTDGFSIEFGDIMLLCGAFFWTAHILAVDHVINNVSPLRFSMVQFGTCSILNLICALIFEGFELEAIKAATIPLMYGGFGSVGIAYTLQMIGQKNTDPSVAAIIFSMESVFAMLGGALILGETMTTRGYIGCALIFAGIILSQIKTKTKKSDKQ